MITRYRLSTLSVSGIPSESGKLMVAVLDSEAALDGKQAPVLSLILPPRTGRITFTTDALPVGTYGVRVMHDESN